MSSDGWNDAEQFGTVSRGVKWTPYSAENLATTNLKSRRSMRFSNMVQTPFTHQTTACQSEHPCHLLWTNKTLPRALWRSGRGTTESAPEKTKDGLCRLWHKTMSSANDAPRHLPSSPRMSGYLPPLSLLPNRCRVVRMPTARGALEQEGEDGDSHDDQEVVFDNLQSQDEAPAGDEEGEEGLEGPLSFVLDDCPFGPGVTTVLKSMTKGERCDAWLDPKYGPGEELSARTQKTRLISCKPE